MNDAENDFTLIPTELDRLRLEQLDQAKKEGRVEAENHMWVALFYETSPLKAQSWQWCSWSLAVNCPAVAPRSAPYELKNLRAVLALLDQLEDERKKNIKGEV